jgi:ABC-type multidrug transport system ATPase subunit
VEGLTLTLTPGGIHWIHGPNGSGKSSLLRVLAGVDPPTAGRICRRPGPDPATTGWVSSEMRLPGSVRPTDWLRLLGQAHPGALRIPELRRFLPRLDAGHGSIGLLSTGQKKRLVLAGALVRPTRFLFLDEPFAHLSLEGRRNLMEILVDRAKRGVLVLASHLDPAGPESLGARIELGASS